MKLTVIFFTYILHSKTKNKFYVGATNNLSRRISEHNSGQSKSTKHGKPWELVFVATFENFSDARKLETRIKKMKSKKFIQELINSDLNQINLFKHSVARPDLSGRS